MRDCPVLENGRKIIGKIAGELEYKMLRKPVVKMVLSTKSGGGRASKSARRSRQICSEKVSHR